MTEFRLRPDVLWFQYDTNPWTGETIVSSVELDFYTRKIIPGTLTYYPERKHNRSTDGA